MTIIIRKKTTVGFLKSKPVHNYSLHAYLGDGVWLGLDQPGVGCYFATEEMCDFGQIINLYKPHFLNWILGEGKGQREIYTICSISGLSP